MNMFSKTCFAREYCLTFERGNFRTNKHKCSWVYGNASVREVSVVQRTDSDRIAGGDQNVLCSVIQDQRELRVQPAEQIQAVFLIERQEQFTVRIA